MYSQKWNETHCTSATSMSSVLAMDISLLKTWMLGGGGDEEGGLTLLLTFLQFKHKNALNTHTPLPHPNTQPLWEGQSLYCCGTI